MCINLNVMLRDLIKGNGIIKNIITYSNIIDINTIGVKGAGMCFTEETNIQIFTQFFICFVIQYVHYF